MVLNYRSFFTTAWVRCQKGTFYDQLNSGARALDLRVTLDDEGALRFKHGEFIISEVTFDAAISDVLTFHKKQPTEVIMLIPSHIYEEGVTELIESSFSSNGIPIVDCDDLNGATVASIISTAGSTLFALFGDECADANYNEKDLVYCRDETEWEDTGDDASAPYDACTKKNWNGPPFTTLFEYTYERAKRWGEWLGGDERGARGGP